MGRRKGRSEIVVENDRKNEELSRFLSLTRVCECVREKENETEKKKRMLDLYYTLSGWEQS